MLEKIAVTLFLLFIIGFGGYTLYMLNMNSKEYKELQSQCEIECFPYTTLQCDSKDINNKPTVIVVCANKETKFIEK